MATEKMKIAVLGLGAIGGTFAAHLDTEKCDISAIARQPTLGLLQITGGIHFQGKTKDGLVEDTEKSVSMKFAENGEALGQQDIVAIAYPADPKMAHDCRSIKAPFKGRDGRCFFTKWLPNIFS